MSDGKRQALRRGSGRETMEQRTATHESTPLTFRSLKIAFSWRCNAFCDHCSVSSGPDRRETLDRSMVLDCIREGAEFGFRTLEFTGGEIFLHFNGLLDFMECGRQCGIEMSIATNAFWATTPDLAWKRLGKLKQSGLSTMIISADRYHQEYIPFSRVVNALDAARKLDVKTIVTVCHLHGDRSALQYLTDLHRLTSKLKFQFVSPFGRAAALPREKMVRYSYARATMPCTAMLNPTVGPDGRVTICCAPSLILPEEIARISPLVLGWLDRESLTGILRRAQQDEFLKLLAAEGIAGIVKRIHAAEPGLYPPRAEGYFGPCDPCIELLGSEPLLSRVRALLMPTV
ncbi:MAG: radical SAM protein [bacterium]|nr:radical SAM protein [bacterium]